MRNLLATLALALAGAACLAAPASATYPSNGDFGIEGFDVTATQADGTPALRAGSHPYAFTSTFGANHKEGTPEGWLRNLFVDVPPGFLADPTAYPRCTGAEFLDNDGFINGCSLETQVGISAVSINSLGVWRTSAVFNLIPPPGALARFGFTVAKLDVIVDVGLRTEPPHNGFAVSRNTLQLSPVFAGRFRLWGDPAAEVHDESRGRCGLENLSGLPPGPGAFEFDPTNPEGEACPVDDNPRPFLTLPTTCAEPLRSSFEAFSWEGEVFGPGGALIDDGYDAGSAPIHDAGGNPAAFVECGGLGFEPSLRVAPTSRAAHSPTGLDISVDVDDEGLTSPGGRSQSRIRKVVLTLPEGITANPSVAEGLAVCSEADLGRETLDAAPGEGCPQASKLGTVEVQSPLVEEPVKGALFQATPFANLAEDSLIALYIVLKSPKLGIIVKQVTRVQPHPLTGQLLGIADDIPQLPFSSFKLHFREGGRSPLASPPLCGTYAAEAEMTPWSGGAPLSDTSTFEIVSGPNGGPCPAGGAPPFEPGFSAGSHNNVAGRHSPFSMRLTRRDGDQDLTRFDATLPPGVVAKLAGVGKCSDAQIALAKVKSGRAELGSPSCPPSSRIGSVRGGAGVGSQLTYVPGSLYLAGPFGGAPLSAVGIVPAVAGPFDIGTVVVRQALRIDPRSAEVTADGSRSDPLPHILAGIPLLVRDIQVDVDRPGFTLNPTDCSPLATRAQIFGGGLNLFSTADDRPVGREARYQAASCASLGFKPRLSLRLRGGTRRGAHPSLRAVLRPRAGDANTSRTLVRLPRSAFLDQGHIRTICTRVQYAAGPGHGALCPKAAIYGRVRAFSPLLDEPLEGPAFLRSSDNNLPDLVFALRGLVDFEAVARIDSIRGGIRATFTGIPDVPISRVVVNMRGGRKGLIVNSTDLCARKHRANVRLAAHNNRRRALKPLVRPRCAKKRARSSHRRG